jgi:hypothetical protein
MGAYVQCSETNPQSWSRFYIIGDGCLKINHACILSEQFYMSNGGQPHGDYWDCKLRLCYGAQHGTI